MREREREGGRQTVSEPDSDIRGSAFDDDTDGQTDRQTYGRMDIRDLRTHYTIGYPHSSWRPTSKVTRWITKVPPNTHTGLFGHNSYDLYRYIVIP